jgi:hypothetical protein
MEIQAELVRGGFGKVRNNDRFVTFRGGSTTIISVGNDYEALLRNFIIKWRTFCKYYPGTGSDAGESSGSGSGSGSDAGESSGDGESSGSGISDQTRLDRCMRDLFRLEGGVELTEEEWCMVVSEINTSNTCLNLVIIKEKMKHGLRSVFHGWKKILEVIFTKLLEKMGTRMPPLIREWAEVDKKYDVQSSSLLLLFANLPNKPSDLPNLRDEKMPWPKVSRPVYRMQQTPDMVLDGAPVPGKKVAAFAEAMKPWHYIGFCPRAPFERINRLFMFPLSELLEACTEMGLIVPVSKMNLSNLTKLSKKLGKLKTKKNSIKNNLEKKLVESKKITGTQSNIKFEASVCAEPNIKKEMDLLIKRMVASKSKCEEQEEANAQKCENLAVLSNTIMSMLKEIKTALSSQ